MKLRKRWLVVGCVVLVPLLLLSGALAYISALDPEQFRTPIIQAAKDATGREMSIDGPIDFAVLPGPRVVVHDVRLANASWGSEPEMLRVKRFEVVLRLLPLAFGEIRIKRLDLQQPWILLEGDGEGKVNWLFDPVVSQPVAPEAVTVVPKDSEPFVLPQIDKLRFQGGRLTFRPGDGSEHVLELDALEGDDPDPPAPLRLALTGRLDGLPMTLSAALSGSGLHYQLDAVAIKLGGSDLTGNLSFTLSEPRPYVEAILSGERIDLAELQAAFRRTPATAADKPAKAEPAAAEEPGDGRLFSETPLPVDALKRVDGRLSLKLGALQGRRLRFSDLVLDGTLQDGVLVVDPLRLGLAGGQFSAGLRFDASLPEPLFNLKADADPMDVGRLYGELTGDDGIEATGRWSLDVTGRGRSAAAIAATLEGNSNLVVGQGRYRTTQGATLVGGLTSALGTMFAGRPEWTVLNCAASRFSIVQGLATNEVMLIDTEFTMLAGEGEIDLAKERLDLIVSARSKVPTITVTVPVKVRGTMTDPRFVPDGMATALRIGGLLTGSGFAATALASLIDLGGNENHCVQLAAGGEEAAKVRTKIHRAPVDSAVGAAGDAAKGVIKGIGKGIGRLLGKDD